MMYLWEIPDTFPENLIGVYDKSRSPDRLLLKQGKPIQVEHMYFRFGARAMELRLFDDLANDALVPLVSPRIGEVLSRLAIGQVQLIPAHIAAADEDITSYAVVVATQQVSATDHVASNYTYVPGTQSIMGFSKLRFREGALGSFHIARDADYLSHLIVSDTLRNSILKLAPRGIGLYRPEERG